MTIRGTLDQLREGPAAHFDSHRQGGNLQDSLGFVLTNFIEMNKLWVRLQHQGLSRDRDKRELERKELRILVGTNLVRLSQLDGVDLDMYQRIILPAVLEQVVNCKDVIAQEYLMEVVIQVSHNPSATRWYPMTDVDSQVFTDDFHLRTLGPFLSATAQLHPKVNIKQIVIALIDRLAAYAAREAESEPPEEIKRQEEEGARRLAEKIRAQKEKRRESAQKEEARAATTAKPPAPAPSWGDAEEESAFKDMEGRPPPTASTTTATNGTSSPDPSSAPTSPPAPAPSEPVAGPSDPNKPLRKYRGIPENVPLFEVFWHQVVELIKARPDLSIQDVTALLVSLTNLALSCYPDRLEYVDQVLSYAKLQVQNYSDNPDLHHPVTIQNLLALLLAPINSYLTVLTLLALPNFQELLLVQPFPSRRAIGHSVVASILKNETVISDPIDCRGVLDMCHVLVRDQRDAGVGMPTQMGGAARYQGAGQQPGGRGGLPYDPEEMAEEQGWLARMVHLLRSDDLDVQMKVRPCFASKPILQTDGSVHSSCKRRDERLTRAAIGSDGPIRLWSSVLSSSRNATPFVKTCYPTGSPSSALCSSGSTRSFRCCTTRSSPPTSASGYTSRRSKRPTRRAWRNWHMNLRCRRLRSTKSRSRSRKRSFRRSFSLSGPSRLRESSDPTITTPSSPRRRCTGPSS